MLKLLLGIKSDKAIWMVVVVLSIFSLLAVYSSSGTLAYRKHGGNTEYYLIRQALILLSGLFLMYVTHNINYTRFSRISLIAFPLVIALLLLTLIFGISLNEANRWIEVFGISFQPSDLAKPVLLVFLARILSRKQPEINDLRNGVLPAMVPVVLVCGLILPANFSTAALILASGMILMYVGRIRLKYLLALAGAGLLLLVLFALVINISGSKSRLDTWESRIENYISGGDAEEDYQVDQAKIAIATGGVLGKSPGKSVQRNFLPHPYSDFIFAIIIEEYGLAGGLFLVLMYLILLFRGVRIATRSKTLFGSLLAFGITFLIVFQAFINMAVAVTLLPVTGQPLPMVSMGGTSLWATCISLGIVLSVSRESDKEEINETTEKDATA